MHGSTLGVVQKQGGHGDTWSDRVVVAVGFSALPRGCKAEQQRLLPCSGFAREVPSAMLCSEAPVPRRV